MPVNATASQVEKRATSAVHPRTAQPSPSPSAGEPNKVKTRSAADTSAQTKAPADLTEARKILNAYHLLPENAPCTAQTLACVLHTLAKTYKMPENVSRVINHVAELMHYADQQRSRSENENTLRDVVKDLQSNLSAEMDSKLLALEKKLNLPSSAQKQLETTAKELESAVESIKASTNDMGKSLAQVTNTNSQLECTATSYKEALLKSNEQQAQPRNSDRPSQTDPRILRDVERKTRQILVDTSDPKINDASNNEIKEKVTSAIKAITEPTPSKDTTILDVSKLRKGGFTVIFKDKEVINWLQDIKVEFDFVTGIAPDATITKQVFPILAPRIPLTFDPTNGEHLREIEECNNFPTGTIEKARWIKLANRRAPGQMAAHAILTIKDISTANTCIRDGISICGLRVRPSRLKHEPMQCMKCRRWGHFAGSCIAPKDTCGTCGGDHRTNECNSRDRLSCVSCKSNEHASWDRDCPEFRRRCDQFDENYPENNLPYFPTEEAWTLIQRPRKIQQADKFPARYAATPLQQQGQPNRTHANKFQGKPRKQQGAKVPDNQATMDRYIDPTHQQRLELGAPMDPNNADAAAPYSQIPPYNYPSFNYGQEPYGWN